MNKGYKIFSGFLGLLLLTGMSAKANKTDGVKSSTEDSVKVKPSRIYNFRLYFQKYYFLNLEFIMRAHADYFNCFYIL